MNKVRLIGDLHIGKRFPYTNKATAIRYKTLLDSTIASQVGNGIAAIQLGDFFDKFSIRTQEFVQGYFLDKSFLKILAGNHDLSKNAEVESSLEHLHKLCNNVVSKEAHKFIEGDTTFVMVPHQFTQELFEQCLDDILDFEFSTKYSVLLLHVNKGQPKGVSGDNYLSDSYAQKVKKVFTQVVSGHEHNMSVEGNLTMIGSIVPTNFGEMTDKFVMEYDLDSGTVELVKVFEAKSHYKKVTASEEIPDIEFVKIVGELPVSEALELNKRIAKAYSEYGRLIAICNETKIMRSEGVTDAENSPHESWVTTVSKLMNEEQKEVLQCLLEV